MTRVKRGKIGRRRREKVMKQVKGFRGARSRRYRTAIEALLHAMTYSYRDRRRKKRDFRRLWITRINASVRKFGLSYSKLVFGLKMAGVMINRKQLAEMAVSDESGFGILAELARSHLK